MCGPAGGPLHRSAEVRTIQPDWQDGGDAPSLYANSTGIAMSQWDITIDFQLATPPERLPPGETRIEARPVARIVMSPTHAKVLAESISTTIRDWEGRFGALPSVDQLLQRNQGRPEAAIASADVPQMPGDEPGADGEGDPDV